MRPASFTRSAAPRLAVISLAVISLAGCGSFSEMLGLERHVPDETKVVVRPPLTLPPDYDLMPPGTATPVSGDHEGAQAAGDANMAPLPPKPEEHDFFGRLIRFEWFGDDEDSGVPKPSAPSAEGAPPAPDVEGTPTPPAKDAPAPATPPASGAPASTPDATPPKS